MIRFVVGPDGALCPDVRARLPGRGAWVDGTAEAVRLAVKRRSFARALKRECAVDPALDAQVDGLLEAQGLQALSFANKAGLVVCGTTRVEAAVEGGGVRGLIHAREASPDGIRKLRAAARRRAGDGAAMPVSVQIFSAGQLDLALGRSHVIHAALLAGGATDSVLSRAARLERYRGAQAGQTEDDPSGIAPDGT